MVPTKEKKSEKFIVTRYNNIINMRFLVVNCVQMEQHKTRSSFINQMLKIMFPTCKSRNVLIAQIHVGLQDVPEQIQSFY